MYIVLTWTILIMQLMSFGPPSQTDDVASTVLRGVDASRWDRTRLTDHEKVTAG